MRTPTHRALATTAVMLALALAMPATAAAAEEDDGEYSRLEAGGENRELNGHHFINPIFVPSAFVNGSFGISAGVGVVRLGVAGRSDISIFAYQQELFGQIGIADWVSIDLFGSGTAAVSDSDLLDFGALTALEVGGGLRSKIFGSNEDGYQLSVQVHASYIRGLRILPAGIAAGLIRDNLSEADAQLVLDALGIPADLSPTVTSESVDVSPAVMFAYGTGVFGMQLGVQSTIGIGLGGGSMTATLDPGLHLAVDFGALTEYFPIALAAEYQAVVAISGGSGVAHQIGGGLYFSGRRDINLGLEASTSLSDGYSEIFGALNLHYYF